MGPFHNLFTVVSAYHVPPHVHVPPIAFPPSLGVGFGHMPCIPPSPPSRGRVCACPSGLRVEGGGERGSPV